jgi:hypothetical protein
MRHSPDTARAAPAHRAAVPVAGSLRVGWGGPLRRNLTGAYQCHNQSGEYNNREDKLFHGLISLFSEYRSLERFVYF